MAAFATATGNSFMQWLTRRLKRSDAADPRTKWWDADYGFTFAGQGYALFVSTHNCGWPPARMTERCVELALADRWLDSVDRDRLLEIGAVTPYYWPHRVPNVVDPVDRHPLVTFPGSMFDIDLTARPVLSISTFEHIGRVDYGMEEDSGLVIKAFEKLFDQSPRFLVTVPRGFNATLDSYLLRFSPRADDIRVRHLVRSSSGNDWHQEEDQVAASLPYGFEEVRAGRAWANSVAIITRGPIVAQGP
jgi:hypothetical protein